MVGHLHLGRILAEAQFRLARFQQPVDIAGRQLHAIAHVRRIDAQQVGILVAQREGAGRRGAQHGKTSFHDRLADRSDIDLRLPFGLIYQSVGDQRHAAALLLFQQLHADAQRVHHPHEILAQRRVVVVDVAAVEIAHLFGESRLRLALLAHPPLERAEGVFGEGAAMIDAHDLIHDHLHGFEPHRGVDDRRQRRRERSHQIGVGEHELAQSRPLLAVLDARELDDVADTHVRRAGHFAAFAVEAVFERLVVEAGLFQAQAFAVGPRLLRPRKERIGSRRGAIDRADSTFDALLEIVFTVFRHHNLTRLKSVRRRPAP